MRISRMGDVMASGTLIDDAGQPWPEHHPQLSVQFGTRREGAVFVDYALRNLGFIRMDVRGACLDVSFHHQLVAPRAVIGLYDWLAARPKLKVVVRAIEDQRPPVLLATRRDAIGYLGRVLDRQTCRPEFIRTTLEGRNSSFATRLRQADAIMRSEMCLGERSEQLDLLFGGRGALSVFDEDVGEFRIVNPGSGLDRLQAGFVEHCRGKLIQQLDNGPYGAWLSERLKEVQTSGKMAIDFVEATLTLQNRQPKRFFYESLLMPLTRSCGRRDMLLVTTVV
jgi:hypothetical protein